MGESDYFDYLCRTYFTDEERARGFDFLLSESMARITRERRNTTKQELYNLFTRLIQKTASNEGLHFLGQRLEDEDNKDVVHNILRGLAELPQNDPATTDAILKRTHDPRWQVRLSAIEAFNVPGCRKAEDRLIELIQTSADPEDLVSAISTLGRIGTRRSVESIESHLHSRKQDVKISANFAVEKILQRHPDTDESVR